MNYGKENSRKMRKKLLSHKAKLLKKITTLFFECLFVGFFALVISGFCAVYGVYEGILASAPDIEDIDATPTGYLSTILDAKGNTTATLVASGSNRIYVTIDEIPKHLQDAFIAVEDSRFREHNGIDVKGIIRAGVKGVASGFKRTEGASTITQQLLKNNVFTNWTSEKSMVDKVKRKIQEQYLAIELERVEDKDWILENYLNTVNLGQNTLGVQSAAKRYFNKDVSELTLSESAVIAGITKSPSRYNPISHPNDNADRRKIVLDDMLEQKLITREQYATAMADDVYSRIQRVNTLQFVDQKATVNSYFVDAVTEQVIDDLMNLKGYTQTEAYKALYNGGLTIYSTQDPDIQAICDEEVNNLQNYPSAPETSFSYTLTVQKANGDYEYYDEHTMLSYYQASDSNYSINFLSQEEAETAVEQYKKDLLKEGDTIPENGENLSFTIQPQAALTIMDQSTGEVKALVGGRGEKTANRTMNRATDATRQPGSTFKVLAAFAPALDTGQMTLASVEDDAPYTYANGTPLKNYDKRYRGFTTVREAITYSINVVTVKTLTDIGIDVGFDYLTNHFGFTTLRERDRTQALALGGITDGVTNLELTGAYAAIANQGMYIKPRLYTKILDHEGNTLIDNLPQKKEAVSSATAWLLTNAMQDVLTKGTGKLAWFDGMSLAGKSGTTTKNRDALFAGYSPYYTCVVWGGYDDNSEQTRGTSYPKLIWKAVMSRVHEHLMNRDFVKPYSIFSMDVCAKSGKLEIPGICSRDPRGSMVITEYFAAGTEPKETCDHHSAVSICAVSGMPAGPYCPSRYTGVRIIGGSGDSEDGRYLYTGNIYRTCTMHTHYQPPEETAPEETEDEAENESEAESSEDNSEETKKPSNDDDDITVTVPDNEDDDSDIIIHLDE